MTETEMSNIICSNELLKADSSLKEAKILFEAEQYFGAANRSYYAVFHAMTALLALDSVSMRKHSGIISKFREMYIKTEIFEREMSDWITALFQLRTDCDYDSFYVVSKEDVKVQLDRSAKMVEIIRTYINERNANS